MTTLLAVKVGDDQPCTPVTEIVAMEAGKVGDDQPSRYAIERGREALKRLERLVWPDWCDIGNALAAGRTTVLHQVNTNAPQGPRYRKCMGEWLRCYGFDRIHKSDRARLLEVADNLVAINAWRDGLSPEEQLRLNSPATVLRAWKRANARTGGGNKQRARSPRPLTVAAIEEAFRHLSAPEQSALLEKVLAEPSRLPPKILAQLKARFVRQHQRAGAGGSRVKRLRRGLARSRRSCITPSSIEMSSAN